MGKNQEVKINGIVYVPKTERNFFDCLKELEKKTKIVYLTPIDYNKNKPTDVVLWSDVNKIIGEKK